VANQIYRLTFSSNINTTDNSTKYGIDDDYSSHEGEGLNSGVGELLPSLLNAVCVMIVNYFVGIMVCLFAVLSANEKISLFAVFA
jgi:hypothetical protein